MAKMITFITDIQSPNEPYILGGFEHHDLVLVPMDEDSHVICFGFHVRKLDGHTMSYVATPGA